MYEHLISNKPNVIIVEVIFKRLTDLDSLPNTDIPAGEIIENLEAWIEWFRKFTKPG